MTSILLKSDTAPHQPGAARRGRTVLFSVLMAGAAILFTGTAYAQSSTIGSQVGTMAQEATTAGGNLGSMAMYVAALICLVGGAWALWQSRQPQNREGGKVAMGLAGIVLCGLFATGGVWIGKAAQTASGGAATITGTNAPVTFN
ncbi:hypothetical protein CTJ15_04070 (plasmid) [Roseomonas sp. FDAARGOS_362]|uniref:hypothetical protein n=1 Tax=unclassified Roseomonas TaxID=2617492 RepID=UPI0002D2EA30|nr:MULTISPECIES: hypothetical protein [unclassified Roseomonas]ATR19545.1 hypothetical protein CTJ15_04070 [Roseomonas sp. FDAARGOS_362]